jgi:H+/Cl- antiporter ClcA
VPLGGIAFWLAVALTGVGSGVSAALLMRLLLLVQHTIWPGSGISILDAAEHASAWRPVIVLLGAGVLTGVGQLILDGLSSGNGIDITAAIWFTGGRLPTLRTLGSAVLSIVLVGIGVSLGREGAPKQAGAVIANLLADRTKLTDEQRRLLVACGAGAGMSAAYGVPLGGALFALEVLRGLLALRLVLPALLASVIAAMIAWLAMPDAPIYQIPAYSSSAGIAVWALLLGPIAGLVSVAYVRGIAWADRNKPTNWRRLVAPVVVLGLTGVVAGHFPQILGNGQDISELAFTARVAPAVFVWIFFLKPLATIFAVRSGTPGGLFTPSLTVGAMLGGALGYLWSLAWPGAPLGLYALVGASAVLAATTQGPISTVVLIMEMTNHARSFIVPVLLAVVTATLVSRLIEPRSIYDARLTDEQVRARLATRQPSAT